MAGLLVRCALLALCLLNGSPKSSLTAGALVNDVVGLVGGVLNTAFEPVAELAPVAGSILSSLVPYTSVLNGLLQQAIVKKDLSQFTSDIVTPLNSIVGILLNASLPVPPPIRPDTEAPLFGFTGEAYNVTTADGYILGVFRIRNPNCSTTVGVIVMPPGVLGNAGVFLFLKEESLAYTFARKCYDVWFFSYRGDVFGRNHVNLSVDSQEFWDYNPYHWGAYDLPAQLEFVSKKTGSTRLQLVGSDIAGTGFAFMNHIYGDRYQKLVSSCALMGPIMYNSQLTSLPFVAIAIARDALTLAGAATLHGELAFFSPTVHSVFFNLCRISPLTCNYFFQLASGPSKNLRTSALPYAARNVLDSISIQAINWVFQQVGHRRQMSFFDFGTAVNIQRYGQATPPIVFLNRTVTPCRLFGLGNAATTTAQDVLDSYNDLAESARKSYQEIPGEDAVGPFVPLDTKPLYGPVVAGVVADTPSN